ncbi:MAG: purine-binding chemotaxis protein CheW [Methanobacteriota archaeon]|nr:MAG: purine-binding chemotaxis protein CheW [Euryarchaeota archaeon]
MSGVGDGRQYIAFRLGREEYAFEISTIREIFPIQDVTKVHRSPSYIEGVMNLRGRLVTVVDLRKRFKLEAREPDENSRIIVVEATDAPVGFLVDEVTEVANFADESVEAVPAYVADSIESEYVSGIAKLGERLITVIDPLKVLELSADEAEEAGGKSNGDDSGGR